MFLLKKFSREIQWYENPKTIISLGYLIVLFFVVVLRLFPLMLSFIFVYLIQSSVWPMSKILVIQLNYLQQHHFEIFCKLIHRANNTNVARYLEEQKACRKFFVIEKIFHIRCKFISMMERIHGEWKSNESKCESYQSLSLPFSSVFIVQKRCSFACQYAT